MTIVRQLFANVMYLGIQYWTGLNFDHLESLSKCYQDNIWFKGYKLHAALVFCFASSMVLQTILAPKILPGVIELQTT